MSADLLAELKKLQHLRSDSSPFSSHIEFLQWADTVSPRLAFDPRLQNLFGSRIRAAKRQHSRGGANVEQINEAVGILNQAVLSLETTPLQPIAHGKQQPLEAQPKVTVKWLYEHVPFGLVLSGLTLLAAAFACGIAFSQTQMYALIKNTISSTPPVAASTSAKGNKPGQTTVLTTSLPPNKNQ